MTKAYILHSTITGNGPVIVMIHGYLASSHYFKTMRQRLSVDHTVVTLDLLGFGKSPKPKVRHTYETQVAAIHDTLSALGVTAPFTLIGHSMGGLIALRYATLYSDDIAGLQLFNPPIFTSVTQATETFKSTGWHYRAFLHSPLRNTYWNMMKLSPRSVSGGRKEINYTDTLRASTRAREDGYRTIITAAELFKDLHRTKHPVLLVVGEDDRPVYQHNLATKMLPATVHLELMQTGHHPIVKNADASEQLIRRHLIQ